MQISERLRVDMSMLGEFSPSIADYYNTIHKIEGLDGFEEGITTFETMLALASSMTGIDNSDIKGLKVTDIYRLTSSSAAAGELSPLLTFLKNMVGYDGNLNISVFKQHMPAVYQELIAAVDLEQ